MTPTTTRQIGMPNWNDYDPVLDAWLACGEPAVELAETYPWQRSRVAVDIETPSVADPFTIKCVTAAWRTAENRVQSIILDPLRNDRHRAAVTRILTEANTLVLHNAAFDVPSLVVHGLMPEDAIRRVHDTIVYARTAYPDTIVNKSLEGLSVRHLGMTDLTGGMEAAFKAAGYANRADGYAGMDIDSPIYRFGAMADTVCTLALYEPIRRAAEDRLLDHPFTKNGITDRPVARALTEREQRVNRIMLRRSARGLAVDLEYMDSYRDTVDAGIARAELVLTEAGIRPGNGNDLMSVIDAAGELPASWPRTEKTGKPSSAKDHLKKLDHPLAAAHREVAHGAKIIGYLESVAARSRFDGRLHPQVSVLGASATGRMAYSDPALQQFATAARPIITDDGQGLTSIDWAQIEPVTLANIAGDVEFLTPFENGADLYEPIQRAAGIDRKRAKVVMLAVTYGQGDKALSADLGITMEAAGQLRRQLISQMPKSGRLMSRISQVAAEHGIALTVSGRILTVPQFKGEYSAYKAVNYTVQGSALDVLHDTIIRCEEAGVGEHIQLAMHDELVVDTPAAEIVEQIMRTPPKSLCERAGRTPVLRTDRADMGNKWMSV